MNNARYVDAVEDALGTKFLLAHRLTSFEIEYKSEVKPGRRLYIDHSERDGKIFCVGRTGGKTCFRFAAEYTERKRND